MRYLILVIAAALVGLLAFSTPRSAAAQGCPGCPGSLTNLTDTEGFLWDLRDGGSVCNGTSDAFDGHWGLYVNGVLFGGAPTATELAGRQIVYGPSAMSGVQVERRVYVPSTGTAFARFYDSFTNPGASPVSLTVWYSTNLGSDGATVYWGSSDGDTSMEISDTWWGSDDADGSGDPTLIHHLRDASDSTLAEFNGNQCAAGVNARYQITVPAGESVGLMTLTSQNSSRAAASTKAAQVASTPAEVIYGLTGRQKSTAANWDLPLDVLIIYDVTSAGTPALQTALAGAGHNVTLSATSETAYTGSNPSPYAFDAVVHLNGTTHATGMPSAGQAALVGYVQNGGGFIHFEWNAYEVDDRGTMTAMTDLTLLRRTGASGGSTFTTVPAQAGHRVMAGLGLTFSISHTGNSGPARTFATDPVTVLATEGANAGVAVREYQAGRVVGFQPAANYTGAATLQGAAMQQLVINAVAWAASEYDNQPPVADAGGPYSGNQGNSIALDGSASTDPENAIALYEWDCTDDGSYDVSSSSPTGSTCTYGNVGGYTVRLRVTDNGGLQATDTAAVTVTNTAPNAAAGGSYTVNQGVALSLDGSASTDPDGSITLFEWDCTADGTYDTSSANSTGSTCTYADVGSYTVRLRVTDDDNAQDTDTATVTVTNTAPTANAGGLYTVNQGVALTLNGGGSSDPDGTINLYEWDCTANGSYDVSSSSPTGSSCTYGAPGQYTVRLRVTDDDNAQDTATSLVAVSNTAPTADAGGPYTVNQGAALSMNGSGSSDPDGSITQYAWDCTNNGVINTTSASPTAATCTYAGVGTFTIALTVTDNNGATNTATGTVNVTNTLPTADAGGPYTAGIPNVPLPLDGSGSFDPDGSVVSWEWDCTNDGSFDASGQFATCTYSVGGGYTLRLRVTDDDSGTNEQLTTVGVATKTVLFVSDSNTDNNIPGVIQADGHTVITATSQYVASTNETTALTYGLSSFDAVIWSATGGGSGDINDGSATIANLTAYVTGGGSLFVTGYDSVASPTDPALAALVGGTGPADHSSSNNIAPLTGASNSITTGVVDIRGVTPTGGYSDSDSFSGVNSADTVVLATHTDGLRAWLLRSLGGGQIAYVPNGQYGPTSAHASWTNTAAGGAGAYNAALRNFVANSSGAVANTAPVADAGGPYSVNQGVALGLDGSASTDPDGTIISYAWDCEDDGTVDVVGTSPTGDTCTYANVATVTLRVTVTDNAGGTSSATASVDVTNTAPAANAGGPYTENQGEAVALDGSASSDADGSIALYEWDCTNDGTYDASSASPTDSTCTYANVGAFTVKLQVTDDDGGTDSALANVTVTNTPPTADAGGAYTVNQGVALSLDGSASADVDGSIVQWEWDCTDDGSYDVAVATAVASAACTYPNVGSETIGLRVTDDDGDTATSTTSVTITNTAPVADAGGPYSGTKNNAVAVDGSASADPDGGLVQWEWDCETDGTYEIAAAAATGDACTFTTVGTFTVTLRVTDDDGGTGTASATATIGNDAPTADAGGPYTGDEGVAISLDGSASTDAGGALVQWEWDCTDDGTYDVSAATATGSSCTYEDDASYTLRLRVTDDDGATDDTATATVTTANVDPSIGAVTVPSGDEGATLTFDGAASDVLADTLTFTWDFGDSTTDTGASVTHVYADDGAYTVTLTVTDEDGGTAAYTATATIANVAPTVTLGGPTTGDEGELLSFTAAGADAGSADIPDLTYTWDWGDTTSDTGAAADHSYDDNGTWTITVTVDDQDTGVTTETWTVTTANVDPTITSTAPLNAAQGALYTYAPTVDDPGSADTLTFTLDAAAPAGMTVDATSGLIEWTPTFAQAQIGAFPVELTVTDDDGGFGTQAWTINAASTDSDNDGMPDDWETDNGFDMNDPSDATGDADLDGVDNVTEYGLGTDPNSFDGPGAVTLVSPLGGAEIVVDMPDLVFDNAVDPQGDVLLYDVEVYSDDTLTTLVTSATGVAEDSSGQTTWTVDVALAENSVFWWRARANDPSVAGAWAAEESFFVNAVDEAPDLSTLVWPIGGEVTGSLTPELLWSAASDVDGDAVTYDVEVWDESMTTLITSTTAVTDGGNPDASWTVDVGLTEDGVYAWTVRTVDEDGLDSGWATAELFFASESNGPPTGTVFTNPLEGASLFTAAVVFAASEAVDPEGTALEYTFEYDLVATFDSGSYRTKTVEGTGTGTVEWRIADDGLSLEENQTTFARVRAIDEDGLSSAPDTISFFVRGENDPPSVPVLVSPADGAEGDGSPTLEIEEPIDPEGDAVTVDFIVARDLELTDILAQVADLPVDGSGTLTWTVDAVLEGEVFWSARAVDDDGEDSAWATPWRYVVPTAGDDDDASGDDDDDGTGTGCDCASSVVGDGASTWALLLLALPVALLRRRR